MNKDVFLRVATTEDVPALLAIYRPYVEETAISFEWETPTKAEFQQRMEKTLRRYPYLVAEKDGEIAGYAYTGAFIARTAYDWTAETTIYLHSERCLEGIGRRLYEALAKISLLQGIYRLYACIGVPEKEDAYLTNNSAEFHEHLGFRRIGTFSDCGYKFGTWYHMIWMEKVLAPQPKDAPLPIPFPQLAASSVAKILKEC